MCVKNGCWTVTACVGGCPPEGEASQHTRSTHAPSLPLVPVPMRGNGRDLGPADQELRWFQPRVRQLQRGGTGLEGTLLEGPRRLCGVCLVEKEKDIAGCRSSTHRGVGWENRALGPVTHSRS